MDFVLLKSFIAVADEKSFSTAAKHLFISQQTLSKQIAKLEDELGTPLFVRSRPLALTQDGKQFLQTAKEIIQLKQQYEETSSKSISGAHYVHLGIEHTVARAILPHVLPRFITDNPDTFIKLSEESPEVLQKTLSYDGVDLVIGSINNTPDSYKTVALCRKRQLLIVPRDMMRSLAGDEYEAKAAEFAHGADLSFFESAPFIKIPRLSSGGRTMNIYLKYYDINPRFVCELTNMENAFQLALSGLGVSIYPELFWDVLPTDVRNDYLKYIHIFPLPYLPDIESVCAYYHKETGLHGKMRVLFDAFTEFFDAYKRTKPEGYL